MRRLSKFLPNHVGKPIPLPFPDENSHVAYTISLRECSMGIVSIIFKVALFTKVEVKEERNLWPRPTINSSGDVPIRMPV